MLLTVVGMLVGVSCACGASAEGAQSDGGMEFTTFTASDSRAVIEQASATADSAGKMVFVDVYAVWCGPCKVLSSRIFPDKKVGTFMNKNFVNIKIDGETAIGRQIVSRYKIQGYPTLLILDGQGKEKGRIVGAPSTSDDFIAAVREQAGL